MNGAKEVSSDVLAIWFVRFALFANNSLSPTQTKMATQCAGEVLHVLGIDEYKIDRTVFKAVKPEGTSIQIDAAPKQQLEAIEVHHHGDVTVASRWNAGDDK